MSTVMPSKHLPFHIREAFPRLLLHLRLSFHPQRIPPLTGAQHERCDVPSHAADILDHSLSLPSEVDLSSMNNSGIPPKHLVDTVHSLGPFLPIDCELLGQGDLKIIGSHPIDAGGFADIWVGERCDGTKVAIKSHRHYSSSSCLPVYLRLYKEALTCSCLNDDDKSFVPFIGVYSTRKHPFALVFKFMDHQNLREYLGDNRDIEKLGLSLEIARGLKHMHSLGILHGNFSITNILVDGDGHVRIAGLGSASILSAVQTAGIDRSSCSTAPELIDFRRWADTGATMADDVYAFGFVVWEVFAGRGPFSDGTVATGVHSVSMGRRPARPSSPELSDHVWGMIKGCWKGDPAQRKTMAEVVAILEAEMRTRRSR